MNVPQVSLESLAEEPSVSVLRLSGDIGIEHISGIVQRVDALPENKRAHLLIDLSAVGFLSSPVVGALMGCRERLSRKGCSISLLSPRPELAEKLELMGVNLVFRHYRTKEDFLKDFRWEAREESRKLQLQIPARAGYVPALRHLISGLLLCKGYSSREAFVLESIVDELSNNAIEHGHPPDKKFCITFSFDKRHARLAVTNSCPELSPEEQEKVRDKFRNPRVESDAFRGRGIALIKKLSDEMTFHVEARKIQVVVTKLREEL